MTEKQRLKKRLEEAIGMTLDKEDKLQVQCNDYLTKLADEGKLLFFHDEKGRGTGKRHRAGWPDLTIFFCHSRVLFIELKQKNKDASHDQKMKMRALNRLGYQCKVIDNFSVFKRMVDYCVYMIDKNVYHNIFKQDEG